MLKILIMTPHDIDFAIELTEIEGWNYTEDDFNRLLFLEPDGLYVAWLDGERAGIISTSIYGDYAFIGTLIVKGEYRKHGIGKRLLKFAIDQLQEKGINSIELDGVFNAVSLYRELGFEDKYLSYRFVKRPGEKSDNTLLYQPQDFSDILDFDKEMTGLDRSCLLNRYIEEFNDRIVMLKKRDIIYLICLKKYIITKILILHALNYGLMMFYQDF